MRDFSDTYTGLHNRRIEYMESIEPKGLNHFVIVSFLNVMDIMSERGSALELQSGPAN